MTNRKTGSRLAFVRRYAAAALAERRREARTPILPAPERPEPGDWPDDRLTVAWLGHATVLGNLFGHRIITDPALEPRVGIGRGPAKFGPRRLVAPALGARELPPIDTLLLSHAHMDHTDLGTLSRLRRGTHAIVQRGNADLARRFDEVTELDWGERTGEELVVEATPARHWGARVIKDTHRGYGGFLLRRRGRTILFAGDTAYTDMLTPLGRREPIDLAILPIGAYDPWINAHASPEEAWRMFEDLGARWLLPIHHATFRLSREPVGEPLERLFAAAGPERHRIVASTIGSTWTLPE